MAEFFFVLLALLYTVVSVKIDEWITISALGFKSETPLMFLKWPRLYDVVRFALLLLAVMVALAMEELPWYMGLVVLGAAWLGAGWIGRKKAFKNYRQILQQMMHSAEAPDEKHQYEAESKKTDEELMRIVQVSMKMEI